MVIVIDAYNMLKQSLGGQFITQAQQAGFIDRLSAYARRSGHELIVVFDGEPTLWQTEPEQKKVKVVYAGHGSTADEVIKEYIPNLLAHNALLVTSDRALRNVAARYTIVSLEPQAFSYYSKLEKPTGASRFVKDASKPHKFEGHESTGDIDALMEKASRVIFYKDSNAQETPKPHAQSERGHKLSKQARKLAQIIDKL